MVLRHPPIEAHIASHPILRLNLQGTTRRFRLLDPTWLGSHPSCQVRLDGPSILARHGVLRTENGRWLLEAEPEAPAIELNGLPIRSAWLAHGDRISLGEITMCFEVEGGAPIPVTVESPVGVGHRLSRDGELEFARRLAALDDAWAMLRAEQRDMDAKIAQAHTEIDRREKHQAEQSQSTWRQFVERQAEWEADARAAQSELRRSQAELEKRSASLKLSEVELAKSRALFEEEQRRLAEDRERHEAEHLHLKSSTSKLIDRVRQQEAELSQTREEFAAEKKAWDRRREEESLDLEVARRELEARSKRSEFRFPALSPLPLADAGVPIRLSAASLPPMEQTGLESLRAMASAIERRLSELESVMRRVELAEASVEEGKRELRQRAQVLDARERSLADREKTSLVKLEPTFDQQREAALLHRERQELAVEARRLQADRANLERTRTIERNIHFEEAKKLDHKRGRLARAYRDRGRRLREKREQVRLSEKRLMGRIALMMRLDGELALAREGIVAERLSTLRAMVTLGADSDWDAVREENEQARRRLTSYVSRVDGILSRLEAERGTKSASHGIENELSRVRIILRESQLEFATRQATWKEEKRILREQISSLEEEVESLAASLLGLDGAGSANRGQAA